jgi:cyclopropane-fatty-acyl-phospholipid synthase
MTDGSLHSPEQSRSGTHLLDRALRGLVWRRLEELDHGRLVIDDDGQSRQFGRSGEGPLAANIEIRDSRFYRHLVFGGSLGAAEAYIRGYWTCDDLVSLVRIFCRNAAVSTGLERGTARILSPLAQIAHWLRRNTSSGSRRNIAAHYDLGNDFFSLFLDDTMAYSCAIFPQAESTLYEASEAKFDRICRKLALTADDQVLEIGSGWGGFALHAAQKYGCRVTTTTISRKQYDYTRQQVAAAGLADRVTVLCEDYRALGGSYDKLVSIEMIEAVGHQYFDAYFRVCSDRLKPDGMMLLQAIVIPDQRYERYRRSVDFIQRYIFPGGCLPSVGAICHSVGKKTDFRLFHLEDITPKLWHTGGSGSGRTSTKCEAWGSPRSSSARGSSISATVKAHSASGRLGMCRYY